MEFAVEGDSNPWRGILIRNLGKGAIKAEQNGNETLCDTPIAIKLYCVSKGDKLLNETFFLIRLDGSRFLFF